MFSTYGRAVLRSGAAMAFGFIVTADAAQPARSVDCSIAERIHGDIEVHHVGSYGGTSELGAVVELDDTGHDVKKLDVLVNAPGKAIVLVLSAYDPVVWNVAWTPGTRIMGAVVSGYHGQAVLGISKSVPLYLGTFVDPGGSKADGREARCPYFYAYRQDGNYDKAAAAIQRITGRPVTRFVQAPVKGIALVGDVMPASLAGLESSSDYRLEDFVFMRKPSEVPAGRRGLEELAKRGLLRRASQQDIDAFEASGVRGIVRGLPAYVVLKPVTLPDGLYGGHSVSILVPAGVPMPDGPQGHNGYFRYGESKCTGPACR